MVWAAEIHRVEYVRWWYIAHDYSFMLNVIYESNFVEDCQGNVLSIWTI